MIAAWYDRQGPTAEVLQVGELPAAEPRAGEVRMRIITSSIGFAGSGSLTAMRRSYRARRLERIHQTQNPARASERTARIAVS